MLLMASFPIGISSITSLNSDTLSIAKKTGSDSGIHKEIWNQTWALTGMGKRRQTLTCTVAMMKTTHADIDKNMYADMEFAGLGTKGA